MHTGDIIYLSAMGQPIVVLNDFNIAIELLDRRAGIYSDRPSFIVANGILSGGLQLPVMPYGETLVQSTLSSSLIAQSPQMATDAQGFS